ncbi:PHD finger protein 10 [Sarcoptes scabiei]|uniref:PHD finger protein 10 n=1 Tax=Sarcoptes scabiei TaxID=52283 RepID=A0A834R9R0_SARSC|nr:PHD finger protein 10 [Sarcoptes scabiei]UXI15074.1 hypothetical protein NH340_JMT01017 [Sarcoptes scabiei]
MNVSTSSHRSNSDYRSVGRGGVNTTENFQNRVMKSVSDYNRQLNQERKEDRRVCMDLQTYTIQYPVGLGRENKGLRRWAKKRKRIAPLWFQQKQKYPVALLPNQYQDWYLQFTPHELKYFPLNTVLHGPIPNDFEKISHSSQVSNGGNNSDSDIDGSDVLSDLDDDSTCSCGEIHSSPGRKSDSAANDNAEKTTQSDNGSLINFNGKKIEPPTNFDENSCPPSIFAQPSTQDKNLSLNIGLFGEKLMKNNLNQPILGQQNLQLSTDQLCKTCKREVPSNENGIRCADCAAIFHPNCLEMSNELLETIRLYRWQCQDCKSCNQCGHPHDEERMMFCDKCDRGYHTYCVGLDHIPQGHWICSLCAVCSNCGTKKPSNSGNDQWQHELIKIHSPDGKTMIRYSIFCNACFQLRKM